MVHAALQAVPIVDRLPLKVACVASWGRDRLLVGTAEGVLFVYQVRPLNNNITSSQSSAKGEQGASAALSPSASPFQINLVDAKKQFARRNVAQLGVLSRPPIQALVSLADGAISVHDLPSFAPRGQLKSTKGSSLFSLNTDVINDLSGSSPPDDSFFSQQPLLACVVKKKLILFTFDPSMRTFVEFRELALPDTPLALAWCGDSGNIVLGFKREYSLLNWKTGQTTELFPTGSGSHGSSGSSGNLGMAGILSGSAGNSGSVGPTIALLPHDQVLLARDNISIFLGFDGKPTRKYGVSWSDVPVQVSHAHPYLLAVTPKQVLEVRSMTRSSGSSSSLVQTLSLKGARLLAVSLEADSPDASAALPLPGSGGPEPVQVIYVAAQNAVWRLQPLPFTMQIDQLIREREFEDALELCDCLPRDSSSDGSGSIDRSSYGSKSEANAEVVVPNPEEREAKRAFVKILYAHNLFAEYQYSQAMEMFIMLRVHPLHVLSLFPGMLPSGGLQRLQAAQTDQLAQLAAVLPAADAAEARIAGLPFGPTFILPPAHTAERVRPVSGSGSVPSTNKPEALRALTEYLLQARALLRRDSSDPFPASSLDQACSADYSTCVDDRVIVDTSLATAFLRLQMGTTGAVAGSTDAQSLRALLSSEHNLCHVAECERMFQHSGRNWEIVLLFRSRKMHHQALTLLMTQGTKQGSSGPTGSPGSPNLQGPEQTVKYLCELDVSPPKSAAEELDPKKLETQQRLLPPGTTSGRNTVEQTANADDSVSANVKLIFKFSEWVLKSYPEAGLAIFTKREPASNRLPAADVLKHVRELAPSQVVPLLEHCLSGSARLTDDSLHNEMVFQYLETILALKRDPVYQQQLQKMEAQHRQQWMAKRAAFPMFKDTSAPPLTAGTEPLLLGSTRRKLIAFLESSKYYVPERMLSRFPTDDLYEERAILLSRIGQHDQALHIYAHRLKDLKQAEAYCAAHYDPNSESNRDVYVALLSVLLKPEETETRLLRSSIDSTTPGDVNTATAQSSGMKPMLEPALLLLNQYCEKLDVAKALKLLPEDTPIAALVHVFETTVRRNNAARRHDQVVKNLLQSENLQVREQLIQSRAGPIYIGEDRMCPVCSKRLGSSVFCAYPSGTVVHYICCRDKTVDPVTGERFSREEAH